MDILVNVQSQKTDVCFLCVGKVNGNWRQKTQAVNITLTFIITLFWPMCRQTVYLAL